MLPGGTAADFLGNGQGTSVEAIIATAGDVGSLLTFGGSKLIAVGAGKVAKGIAGAEKLIKTGIGLELTGLAIQGGVLGVRGYQLATEIAGDGNGRRIAGLSGEIVIRRGGPGHGGCERAQPDYGIRL
jgi:hypothetical protein